MFAELTRNLKDFFNRLSKRNSNTFDWVFKILRTIKGLLRKMKGGIGS